jgi:outer membrane protein assembly factor BamD (BamD/ComL family)
MNIQNKSSVCRTFITFIMAFALLPLMQSTGGGQRRSRSGDPAQTPNASGPEMKAFRDGKELLLDENWVRAAERFNDYITDYPKDANVDAALYWLAFALKKQDRFREAERALNRLIADFPASTWTDDAKALRIEIAPRLGNTELIDKEANASSNDEARLVALRNLFSSNPEQAVAISANVFVAGSGASGSFKESAVTLLGRYGGKQAWPLLIDIARRESDIRLRKSAIYWLGKEEDANTLAALKNLALRSSDSEVGLAAVSAILQQGSPQALESLSEITNAAISPAVRNRAESLLQTGTGISSKPNTGSWLLIKDRQLLLFSSGRIIKLSGSGNLTFKRDGQVIEVPNGLRITVNGEAPFKAGEVRKGETADVIGGDIASRERLINGNETVSLVDQGQRTIWELSLAPVESANVLESGNWFTINGEFNVSGAPLKDYFLYAKPAGGVKMR